MLSSLDLFSGIGGITLALHGIAKPIAYCEINPSSQRVLKKHIDAGDLPKAPVYADVKELNKSIPITKKVDAIVGGWPCQDISLLGTKKGLDGARSGLIYEMIRLTDELKPKVLFLENVPPVLIRGFDTIREEFVTKRGYNMRWAVVPASSVGAPHVRRRWFCLLTKPDFRLRLNLDIEPTYRTFAKRWRGDEPERMYVAKSRIEKSEKNKRTTMLGNGVVPDAVRAAFILLFQGFRDVPSASTLVNTKRIIFQPPPPALLKLHDEQEEPPMFGICNHNEKEMYSVNVPKMKKPAIKVHLCPSCYHGFATRQVTRELIKEDVHFKGWSTPRFTSSISQVLTGRSVRDLSTQVRFAIDTPNHLRVGAINPVFVEWLMGFPRNWTKT